MFTESRNKWGALVSEKGLFNSEEKLSVFKKGVSVSEKEVPVSERGATISERLLESARRNNIELLSSIRSELNHDDNKVSELINSTREIVTANTSLHLACKTGNWDFIDKVLDIEGVEIDPKNREGATPLHLTVKYSYEEPEHGYFIVDNLLDVGSDPRVTDNHNLKPIDYVEEGNNKLKDLLASAEYAISAEAQGDQEIEIMEKSDDEEGFSSE